MNLTLVTDTTAANEPIQVSDAAAYLRLDSATQTSDAAMIQTMISAARLEAENEHGREVAQKQWTVAFDNFPPVGAFAPTSGAWWVGWQAEFGYRSYQFGFDGANIELLDPLVSVDSFTWKDSTGTVNTLVNGTDFISDPMKHPGIVSPTWGNSWPTGNLWPSSAVEITFTCGYTPTQCPASIKQGILMLVSQWYEGRIPFEAIRFAAELPFSVTSLLRAGRRFKF